MDGQDDGPFFLCHNQVNGAKVVRCDDNSNNVIVVRADTLYCRPFSNGCQPFRFIVGPTVLLSGQQYSVSALLNHVIVIITVELPVIWDT